MPRVVAIENANDPRLADYGRVREPILLRERGVFIAESREVVRILLEETTIPVRSLLLNEATLAALEPSMARLPEDTPVYLANREVTKGVVGYDIHRGCLAAAERPTPTPLSELLKREVLVVLETVTNPDNVGTIFRNTLTLGGHGVVLSPRCADPYYRKAIRTSMGTVLRLPHAVMADWPKDMSMLRAAGFQILAFTPHGETVPLSRELVAGRVAILLGNEGAGLTPDAMAAACQRVRIPIAPGTDSVNVATASGIALYVLGRPGA